MKNTICIFFSSNKIEKLLSVYNDLITSFPSKYEKFYLINFYEMMNNNQKDLNDYKKYEHQYNIKIICPKNKKNLIILLTKDLFLRLIIWGKILIILK